MLCCGRRIKACKRKKVPKKEKSNMKISKELYDKIKEVEDNCLKNDISYNEALAQFKEIGVDESMVKMLIAGKISPEEQA